MVEFPGILLTESAFSETFLPGSCFSAIYFHGNFFPGNLFPHNLFSGVFFSRGLLIWGFFFLGLQHWDLSNGRGLTNIPSGNLHRRGTVPVLRQYWRSTEFYWDGAVKGQILITVLHIKSGNSRSGGICDNEDISLSSGIYDRDACWKV